jgi:hypothetical protein
MWNVGISFIEGISSMIEAGNLGKKLLMFELRVAGNSGKTWSLSLAALFVSTTIGVIGA